MVEQKNGAVVRRIVGYRRTVGLEAAATLGRLYGSVRLFVNFFQPSFKLAGKVRDGAKVTKRYHAPATPYQRLMADPRTSEEVQRRVGALHATLDPVRLLSEIRLAQQQLVEIADRPVTGEATASSAPTLAQFLLGLRTSWQEGEVRPTAKPKKRAAPYCRHVLDPLEAVSAQVRGWFEAEPWRTARELLERLQGEHGSVKNLGQPACLSRADWPPNTPARGVAPQVFDTPVCLLLNMPAFAGRTTKPLGCRAGAGWRRRPACCGAALPASSSPCAAAAECGGGGPGSA